MDIGARIPVTALAALLAAQSLLAQAAPVEDRIRVGDVSLYARSVGQGPPAIVLHGGPDFDHAYFLPDLDRLSDILRLVYFDQRGRGRSAEGVDPESVTIASEVADIDAVRQHYLLDAPIVIGHSWGTVLALEYALRYPTHVSRLILMNPAPASASDVGVMRKYYLERVGAAMDDQRAISTSAAYQAGDPDAVAARYRIHFKPAFAREADFERLMTGMEVAFVRQGKEGILEARAVEDHLMLETWAVPTYDLHPKLSALRIPTLVIYGDHDFIPIDIARHAAAAIPGARLVTIENCGHFSYLECPEEVRKALAEFMKP